MTKISFRAGTDAEINNVRNTADDWLFIDMGFARKGKRSCGLLDGLISNVASALTFKCLCKAVIQKANQGSTPLFLVIEAPLSRAFEDCCPCGREATDSYGNVVPLELQNSQSRYWYQGGGIQVMTATGHLLRELSHGDLLDTAPDIKRQIILFEGFVSFKTDLAAIDGEAKHMRDVLALRDAVLNGSIWKPKAMGSGILYSIDSLFGLTPFDPPLVVKVDTELLETVTQRDFAEEHKKAKEKRTRLRRRL